MKTRYRAACARRKPDDLLAWASAFIHSPASTDRDRHEREIVAALLAEVSR